MKRISLLLYNLVFIFSVAACGCGNVENRQPSALYGADASTGTDHSGQTGDNAESQQPAISDTADVPMEADSSGVADDGKQPHLEEVETMQMKVQVGDAVFSAVLEKNTTVDAFIERMENGPVTIQMRDYSGFEKVGDLGGSLPANNSRTTAQSGDIVLYNGNQIVIFYGSNTWSYTRIGKIDNLTGWAEALGSGDVTVTFSLD